MIQIQHQYGLTTGISVNISAFCVVLTSNQKFSDFSCITQIFLKMFCCCWPSCSLKICCQHKLLKCSFYPSDAIHRTSSQCFLQADDSRETFETRSRHTVAAERKIYGIDDSAKVNLVNSYGQLQFFSVFKTSLQ